ncbi:MULTISPECIES: hypothetical protein [Gammaproteobacteria]|uniref:hypothetical protein n=1 Tax=Gammaproteobacteria TaxID=1236 RepID=UPI000DD044A9|nr:MULTISPECIES: hypothetical protein [Gammaproteobacteria]RTE85519.1 hypothetical protein DQX04_11490 [Aliidiomarina sp. B3213]TCZ89489.1 hypothetical protein EYQ95_11420 [Lysobacter sp. N42]
MLFSKILKPQFLDFSLTIPAVLLGVFLFLFSPSAQSSSTVVSLVDALQSGQVSIERLSGNGSSSGSSISGTLRNNTNQALRIGTNINPALYLENSNPSNQNMIAFQIYLRGGGYYRANGQNFIELASNRSTSITLIAYCADFEKGNPTYSDSFAVKYVPQNLSSLANKIARYKRNNPNHDTTVPAQVALWLGQGVPISEIKEMFSFNEQDEQVARMILNY